MDSNFPLVSIVTPVFNGERYLGECIESVLKQTYKNWNFTIINNYSTDGSLAIADAYAKMDPRIKVYSNDHFVGVIENHNIAFRSISPESKYCKLVSADDWIYPDCLSKMVELAESHPSIAIVGCYAISSEGITHVGLSPEKSFFKGEEVCRSHLLGDLQVFGAPTAFLYRSDIIRIEHDFYYGNSYNADTSTCFRVLRNNDFGFVHQVLAYERIHDGSLSTQKGKMRGFRIDKIDFLINYGKYYLAKDEFHKKFEKEINDYYIDVLAPSIIHKDFIKFIGYHRKRLKDLGLEFESLKLIKALLLKFVDTIFNPKMAFNKYLAGKK